MRKTFLKTFGVMLGATVLSTIGIFAADQMSDIDRNLVGLVGLGEGRICEKGMTLVRSGEETFCIDVYEASSGGGCEYERPKNVLETEENVRNIACSAVPIAEAEPWRFVSLTQAQQLCTRSGKRLPTKDEWYKAALGTSPESCIVNNGNAPAQSGTSECISSSGAYDMVGNVWEWVDETVIGYSVGDQPIPPEGYVDSVDAAGLAITTGESANALYGDDYFWSEEGGVFGMIRGGFYGSGEDAGLYAINASVATNFASPGVGFRCVKDI